MAPLPKRRHSTHRQGRRRAVIHQKATVITTCKHCGISILPHRVCPKCGFYGNKQIVIPKTKKAKKASK